MRRFTTAVVVRLAAAALAGGALSATVAQVAQAAEPHTTTVPAAVSVTVGTNGVADSLPNDNWPWG
jgi:hypothetical protein